MLVIENEWIKASFKSAGGELISFIHKENQIEYLWQGDSTFWGRQAPVLFPIVGRLKDDQYLFEDTVYPMNQHGFARDCEFTVSEQTSESITFSLKSDKKTKIIYPFDFELGIQYSVEKNKLSVRYLVKNCGQETMWYSVGGHPAFNVPLNNQGTFEDYAINFQSDQSLNFLPLVGPYIDEEQSVLKSSNTTMQLTRELFSNDALVFETAGKHAYTIYSELSPHQITVSYKELHYVGIWSPYPKEAPFVCIEPWQGVADTLATSGKLTEKKGIVSLNSKSEKIHEYTIEIK